MTTDDILRDRASQALSMAGIDVRACKAPLELFTLLGEESYTVVVLDVTELGEQAYAVLARLCAVHGMGVVVVGVQLTVEARIRCLQSGADACLPGPVDERELAGIVLALARRLSSGADDGLAAGESGRASGAWELRDQDWTLVSPAGVPLSLSANERLIVRALLDLAGRSISRAELAERLAVETDAGRSSSARSIDVIVSRLRRKAEMAGLVLPIRTVYGSGYLFAAT